MFSPSPPASTMVGLGRPKFRRVQGQSQEFLDSPEIRAAGRVMGPILQGTSMVGQEVARELVVEQVEQGQHQGSAEVGRAAQEEGEVAAAEVATDSEEDEEIASQELRRGFARGQGGGGGQGSGEGASR